MEKRFFFFYFFLQKKEKKSVTWIMIRVAAIEIDHEQGGWWRWDDGDWVWYFTRGRCKGRSRWGERSCTFIQLVDVPRILGARGNSLSVMTGGKLFSVWFCRYLKVGTAVFRPEWLIPVFVYMPHFIISCLFYLLKDSLSYYWLFSAKTR